MRTSAGMQRRAWEGLLVICCYIMSFMLTPAALAQTQTVDSPYVPTPWNVVDAMLSIAGVGRSDYLIDLGSGDGRIVITAAKKLGARGFGVDLDPNLVNRAQREAERQGVSGSVTFNTGNLFMTDIGQATVLTMYLLPKVNLELRPRLFAELKPGTRVVSHDFDFGNWKPDGEISLPVPEKSYGPPSSSVFMWVIPADASGKWTWRLPIDGDPRDFELTLEQTFQMLKGSLRVGGLGARLERGRMRGDEIRFTLTLDVNGHESQHEFIGRVNGDVISGKASVAGAAPIDWNATRLARGKINIDAGTGFPVVAQHF
jgi:hypothetical protein